MAAPGHPLDPLLGAAGRALRFLFAPAHASRPVPVPPVPPMPPMPESPAPGPGAPAEPTPAPDRLSEAERRQSAALMRVNHAGEVAAQALYHGQAFAARSEPTRRLLLEAAREETDHLAWCERRLSELHSRTSLLDPLWYLGSFAIGTLAAVSGDRTSLGFVVETERQVERHLDDHLRRLPAGDLRSRAILEAMRQDEMAHAMHARAAGGIDLPTPLCALMRHTARIMTHAAYFI